MNAAYKLETAGTVMEAACDVWGYTMRDLVGRKRTQTIARRRNVAMALVRERLGLSYAEIGIVFKRDHTTVIKAVQTADLTSPESLAVVAWLDRGRK